MEFWYWVLMGIIFGALAHMATPTRSHLAATLPGAIAGALLFGFGTWAAMLPSYSIVAVTAPALGALLVGLGFARMGERH